MPTRLASMLLVFLALSIVDPNRACARERMLEDDLAEVRRFSAILRTPLTRNERHPWLATLSHLTGEVGEPHLTAVQGLSSIHIPAASFALIDALDDASFPYRDMAAAALRRNPHPSALPALIRALDDPDPRLRRISARALGIVAAMTVDRDVEIDSAVRKLLAVLAIDPEPIVRVAAFHGLSKLATMEILEQAFDTAVHDPHRLVRCGMMVVAAHIAMHGRPGPRTSLASQVVWNDLDPGGTPATLGVLTRALHRDANFSYIDQTSDCVDVGEQSLALLAKIRNRRVLPVLLRLASSPDAGLRATVVRGLAEYEDEAAFEAVTEALDDPISGVRRAAIEGLGESENPRAGEALMRVLRDGAPLDKLAAAFVLEDPTGEPPPGEVSDYISVIPTENRSVDRDALPASRWGRSESDALIEAFGDESARVRQAAEKAMRTKPDDSARSYVAALADEKPHVRVRAARMLAESTSRESFDLLVETLTSGQAPQSDAAALALGLRGDPEARPALERTAESAERNALAVAAIDALQDLRVRASLPLLRRLASESDSDEIVVAAHHAISMLSASREKTEPHGVD